MGKNDLVVIPLSARLLYVDDLKVPPLIIQPNKILILAFLGFLYPYDFKHIFNLNIVLGFLQITSILMQARNGLLTVLIFRMPSLEFIN